MDINKTKQHFVYELLPAFIQDLSSITTETSLKQLLTKFISEIADYVFPDSQVILKSLDTELRLSSLQSKSGFKEKAEISATRYSRESQKTMQAILVSIAQHEEKLRIINSN